jgi:hypothetical protein
MSADQNLNPQQFYHGTPAELKAGDMIHPATAVGVVSSAPSVGNPADHTYFTTKQRMASYYSAPRITDEESAMRAVDASPSQGHIYKVEPTGKYDPDPHEPDSFHSSQPLRVVGKSWSRLDDKGNHNWQPDLGVDW